MNNRKINILIIYLLLIWTTLAAYFAFTDLKISISVVNQNSGWAIFLENFGEIPGLLVLYSGAVIFIAWYKFGSKLKYYAFSVFVFIAAVYLSRRISIIIYNEVTGNYDIVTNYKLYIFLIFFVLNWFLYTRLKKLNYSDTLKTYSKVTILLGLYGYLFLVQPIKQLCGRVRFRDLDALYSNFTPWFLPNGINGNQSFPSGHAAMAWIILPLLLLVVNKSTIIKIILLVLIFSWGLAVSLSRVEIGAHYASDALFGALIILIVFLLLIKYTQNYFILSQKSE
ncbi:MAG: phosphatase PAP2 family protein [Bacteroidetes bacterium]|nr:phosphatase PAP2 family protein [Bacteroidota bacterium]